MFARYLFILICKTYKQECLHRKWPCGNRVLSSSGREDRRLFSALLSHVLFVVLALETLTSVLAAGGIVCWSAQVDVTLETGIFFTFSDFHVMVSRQYLRWKLKFSFKLQGWLLIIVSSTHLDKPGSGPYMLTYTSSSLTQDLQPSFESTISRWITPLCSLYLTFIFITFWEHDYFTSFQSSASSEGLKRLTNLKPTELSSSSSSPVSHSPTRCHGTPVQRHHGWLPTASCTDGCSPSPSMPAWLMNSSDRTRS